MTAATDLLAEARAAGVELALRDGRMCLRGPCPPALRARLQAARDELRSLFSTHGDTGDGDDRTLGGPARPTSVAVAAKGEGGWRRGEAPPKSCGPYSRHAGPWRRRIDPPGPWVCERCHPWYPGLEKLGPWERFSEREVAE